MKEREKEMRELIRISVGLIVALLSRQRLRLKWQVVVDVVIRLLLGFFVAIQQELNEQ